MDNLPQTKPHDLAQTNSSSLSAKLRPIFVGEHGIRAGWSALLFVAIYLLLETATTAVLGHLVSLGPKEPIPLGLAFLQESCELALVFIATALMARIENRQILSYGYIGPHKAIRFVSGALWGFLCLSLVVGILWKAKLLIFDGASLTGLAAWKYAFGWALLFLLVGIFEESLLRGYLQYTLSRGIGFWWAALLLSLVFALWHASNNGESPLGLMEVGLSGLYFCLSLWYTKSLWWAVGFHAGWDWGQSYFYGTPDSGLVMKGHLLTSHSSGNPVWSGGATGPEGSLLILPLVIVMSAGMWIWWGRKRKASLE
ncbi:MAG TPA: CPBP family intramembrane glutamic endopeptidase [Candidatus Dormibacteraeota bacterium]|jgi:membrane protease YdiL (CAAX protease family)|nr:CPBP family intramembrane glutamic endopeptidase [Candidatus Dormibacteraeota bacterium]